MKKRLLKISLAVILMFSVFAASAIAPSALVLYESDGYTYADIDSNNVALYNWDNRTPNLVVDTFFNDKAISSVYRYAFQNNKEITSIDFSNAALMREIGNMAFCGCENIYMPLVLPNTLDKLGFAAFQDCTSLPAVTISNVSVIPQQCFYNDVNLRTVNLPISLKRIEKLAFANCEMLRNIFIPSTVEYIDNSAFDGCRNVVFTCYSDSYAYEYAVKNNIPYILLDAPEPPTEEPTTDESTSPATPDEPTAEPTEEPTTESFEPGTEEPTEEPTTEPATNPATPDEPVIKLGDVNGDGIIDVLDALIIQKTAVEKEVLTEAQKIAGDINRDGFVDVLDATLIQKYAVGKYVIE